MLNYRAQEFRPVGFTAPIQTVLQAQPYVAPAAKTAESFELELDEGELFDCCTEVSSIRAVPAKAASMQGSIHDVHALLAHQGSCPRS